jgi:hypothetical protein
LTTRDEVGKNRAPIEEEVSMCSLPRRSVPLVVVLAACAVAGTGCAARQPPPPATPPGPRTLTVYAERNQTQAQLDQDKAQCHDTASAQATSSEGWTQIFTSCMAGRGYAVR